MKRMTWKISGALATAAFVLLADQAFAGGVAVGSSLLINQLQYSDTFTETVYGGSAGRVNGTYPTGAGLAVENSYGHPAQSWTATQWTFASNDLAGVVYPAFPGFPGNTGAGSATGMMQLSAYHPVGLGYGLGRDFIAQMDAVQPAGGNSRIAIAAGNTRDSFASSDGLTVFFISYGTSGTVSLYNPNVGDVTALTISSPLVTNTWHNYAVWFHLSGSDPNLDVYLDQARVGTIDLNTFFAGNYKTRLDSSTANAISVGDTDNSYNYTWIDNLQLGIPEPSTVVLLGVGGLLLGGRRRR